MRGSLPGKVDQWDFVDSINRLTHQVETLQWRMSDAVPNAKRGLTYMAAVSQLGQAFVRAARGFTELGKAVASAAALLSRKAASICSRGGAATAKQKAP